MKFRHVIRPAPKTGIHDNGVLVDGHWCYVETDDEANPPPADALYVCVQDTEKPKAEQFTVEKDATAGKLTSKQSFSGWPTPASAK